MVGIVDENKNRARGQSQRSHHGLVLPCATLDETGYYRLRNAYSQNFGLSGNPPELVQKRPKYRREMTGRSYVDRGMTVGIVPGSPVSDY
jgi:hypothetical protein